MSDVNLKNKLDFSSKMGEVYLEMKGIHKRFAGVHALKGVDFNLKYGEVHALMGENGAGKSTLMKVLTGIHQPTEGSMTFQGAVYVADSINDSQHAGIGIVHQELNMMNHLTVAQNIFIGREFMKTGAWIDDAKMNKESTKLFDMLGINIDPSAKLGTLTVGKQQMVEIAKAVSHESKVIVFDEPTAALTSKEIDELFKIIRDLQTRGIGIVYISHRMDEVMDLSDRITVMRDGEYAGTVNTKEVTKDDIIQLMIGRVVFEEPKSHSMVPEGAEVVLEVRNLTVGRMVNDLSFNLRRGEILGFAGLMGAGRTEMARAIFGADIKDHGTITRNGRTVSIRSPKDAVAEGISYLSEDRKRYGLLLGKSIAENSSLATLDKYIKHGWINDKKIAKEATEYNAMLRTKTPSIQQLLKNLSGGNQQKVIIAKWLIRDCEIIIFDEPTRGIDVGAKSEIYQLMNKLAAEGKSIIMISSELVEIQRMSDRVIVMCEGRKTAELDIKDATSETIMKYATLREGV